MILTTFDVKFHEKEDEIPPWARRQQKQIQKFKNKARQMIRKPVIWILDNPCGLPLIIPVYCSMVDFDLAPTSRAWTNSGIKKYRSGEGKTERMKEVNNSIKIFVALTVR